MQAYQLFHSQEQKDLEGKIGDEKVLQILQKAYLA